MLRNVPQPMKLLHWREVEGGTLSSERRIQCVREYSKNPKKKTFVRGPKPLKRKTFDVLSQIDHFRKTLIKKL